jgi:hypothetical protein
MEYIRAVGRADRGQLLRQLGAFGAARFQSLNLSRSKQVSCISVCDGEEDVPLSSEACVVERLELGVCSCSASFSYDWCRQRWAPSQPVNGDYVDIRKYGHTVKGLYFVALISLVLDLALSVALPVSLAVSVTLSAALAYFFSCSFPRQE